MRGHWSVENSCHWVLDVVFGEDHCRVRTGHAAAPMVVMGPEAVWRGDLQTAKLDLHPQSRIVAGRFRIRPDRMASPPSKGR